MTAIAIAITVLAVFAAASDTRKGLLMVLVVGVLQDPFRKLTAGAPPYYILWSMMVFLSGLAFSIHRGLLAPVRTLGLQDKALRVCWSLTGLLVGLQFIHAFVRWGPLVPVLGGVEYVVPLLAVLLGVGLGRRPENVGWLFKWYVLIVSPVALTVYLSVRFADRWTVLKDVGVFTDSALIIYDRAGVALESFSGLFRTGEIAAWHAATAAVLIIILTRGRHVRAWALAFPLVVLLVGAIVYTGRRKMIMALTIFFVMRLVLQSVLKRGAVGRLGLVIFFAIAISLLPGLLPDTNDYVNRGWSVYDSTGSRSIVALSLADAAVHRSGGIGLGLGVSSQGSRYTGTDLSSLVGGAGESGIGKIILEFGLPGLLLVFLLLVQIGRRGWRIMRRMQRMRDPTLDMTISLAAFLAGQIATFVVATQIFGDPFVLIILGLTTGFLFGNLYSARTSRQVEPAHWTGHRGGIAERRRILRHQLVGRVSP